MKQIITKEQWDELDKEKQDILRKKYPSSLSLSIGEMIEFLDDDLTFIEWNYSPRDIKIVAHGRKTIGYQDLCDALWEAVKEKLQNV